MRILRFFICGSAVLASTAVVAFVCADRLAHLAPVAVSRTIRAEPSTTGSVPAAAKPAAVKQAAPGIPNGFDTERLHALMRGDPILPGR